MDIMKEGRLYLENLRNLNCNLLLIVNGEMKNVEIAHFNWYTFPTGSHLMG